MNEEQVQLNQQTNDKATPRTWRGESNSSGKSPIQNFIGAIKDGVRNKWIPSKMTKVLHWGKMYKHLLRKGSNQKSEHRPNIGPQYQRTFPCLNQTKTKKRGVLPNNYKEHYKKERDNNARLSQTLANQQFRKTLNWHLKFWFTYFNSSEPKSYQVYMQLFSLFLRSKNCVYHHNQCSWALSPQPPTLQQLLQVHKLQFVDPLGHHSPEELVNII